MNLDALTQIPLADLGMGMIALVLVIGGSLYARKHGISLRVDSPAHQFLDELDENRSTNPAYGFLAGNVFHHGQDK